MKPRLTPRDWIQASFRALSNGGPQAIRAEAIARALKVSKGSFYWHFTDVPSLKQAMLEHWIQTATKDIIDLVESEATDAKARLHLLVRISTSLPAGDYGGALAEAAIRDWARYDKNAAKALKSVDRQRLKFVKTQFQAHGMDEFQSKQNATILYAALIGLKHLAHHNLADPLADLTALLEHLLKD